MNELFETAYDFVDTKTKKSKEMSKLAKEISIEQNVDISDVKLYKDMIHYKGLGWVNNNPIGQPDPNVRFKDRVSPCFRKIASIIAVAKEFGDMEILEDYFEAMRKLGIEITVRDIPDNSERKAAVEDRMQIMSDLQGVICHNANKLRDMGEKAELDKLCPKNKFKDLSESYYKVKNDIKVEDRLQKQATDNIMHNHGIEEVIKEKSELI